MATKKMKDGRWYSSFYYTDWTGERKRKKKEGFKTKREAEEWEKEFLEKLKTSSDLNFNALLDSYMEDCKTRLKPTTYDIKSYVINLKIRPFFKKYNLNEITPIIVRNWQNALIKEGKYSQTYLKTINNQLSAVFNYAVKYHGLVVNPARQAGSMGKKNADTMKFLTLEEFNKTIKFAFNDTYKVLFSVLFYTGIRIGELLALTPNDVKENRIIINKTFARIGKKDIVQKAKTEKSMREVMIPEFIYKMLTDYINRIYKIGANDRIFFMHKCSIARELNTMTRKAGVNKIRVHDLRHSHASLLVELGYSPMIIAERLGHEDIQTTLNTYSHLYPNKQNEVVAKLQELNNSTNLVRTKK